MFRYAFCASALLSLSACASAPGGDRDARDSGGRIIKPAGLLFATYDANDDFRIDAAEVEAGVAASFERADSDRDGDIGLVELANWAELTLGAETARPGRFDFDTDASGRITRAEFVDTLTGFAERHAGEDGVIAFSELTETVSFSRRGGGDRSRPTSIQRRPTPGQRRPGGY